MGIDFTGSTLALVIVLFAVGLICIIKGGDLFVDAATWIAEASGIPKFIIGATVVSFATTMPEMLVSVFSAFEGNADIAVGNAVGSVTANTGLIMCLSLVCMSCYMTRKQFGVKAGLLLAAVVLLFTFTRDSALSVSESIIIMLVFVGFMVESILAAKREQGSEATDERPSTDGKSVAINIGKFVLGAAAIVLGAQLRSRLRDRRDHDSYRHLAARACHYHHGDPKKAVLAVGRQYHRREYHGSDAYHAAVCAFAGQAPGR